MSTIKDVAKKAGVSVKTVSRVLNDEGPMRVTTRQKVLDAIENLNYTPQHTARQLRTQRSNTIGLLSDEIATSPFAVDIIKGAQREAWKHGKLLLVVNTERDTGLEREALEMMLERRVEGILYAAMFHRSVAPDAYIDRLPAVLINCFSEDGRFDAVVPDEVRGGYVATRALIEQGHERIGFINLDPIASTAAATGRLEGYRRALAENDLPYDETLIRHATTDPEQGYLLTLELMEHKTRPTALFCGNDRMAVGAYCAIYHLGLRIPDDVAVVGFDDQKEIDAFLWPALTTVALPHFEMGRWGVKRLLTLNSESTPSAHELRRLPCPLVPRASH